MKWVHVRHGLCVAAMSSFNSVFVLKFSMSFRRLSIDFKSVVSVSE